jgi:signal transduction histidine kinase
VEIARGVSTRVSTRAPMSRPRAWRSVGGVKHLRDRTLPMLNDLWGEGRNARFLRLVLLAAFTWTAIAQGRPAQLDAGAVAFGALLVLAVAPWVAWTVAPGRFPMTLPGLVAVAAASGLLGSFEDRGDIAAALFSVLTVAAATERLALGRAGLVALAAAAGLLAAAALQQSWALVLLACVMPAVGLVTGLARHQYVLRAEGAELLLAEMQRTREEQARAAAMDERVRVAREVHDVLAHSLAALAIQLEAAEALLVEGEDVEGATVRVQRSRRLAVEGLDETRRAVAALRGGDRPLPDELARLVDAFRDETGGDAQLELVGEPRELDADVRLAFRRIAQEALTNVRKHAPGAAVDATLRFAGEGLSLVVRSRGASSAAPPLAGLGGGYGIEGMRERAHTIGAALSAGPIHDGWEVEARWPA